MSGAAQQTEFDIESLRAFMALSAKEKLEFLEELNRFLAAAMPEKSKKIWDELRANGA